MQKGIGDFDPPEVEECPEECIHCPSSCSWRDCKQLECIYDIVKENY